MSASALALSDPLATPTLAPQSSSLSAGKTTDQELVLRFVARGDESAFIEIMNRYRAKILSVTLGLLRNHADAEEITQDTFIRAHRGLPNFRGDSSLSTWLYRIAVNLSRNRYWYFFRRRRQDSISLDSTLHEGSSDTFSELIADIGPDPAQASVVRDFSSAINRCMSRLAPTHREVLNLRNALDHSYEEIAGILGVSVGTVKSRISRAREELRGLLTEICPEASGTGSLGQWFLRTRATYGRPAVSSP